MEKDILAVRIKELRMSKGYSQEYLSEVAQLSLRTVQRIENAETESRGDTLNRLAKALGVDITELTDSKPNHNENGYLALMNASALAFLIFVRLPFLSFVFPLILWLYKKNKSEEVRERGKRILNLHITWCVIITLYFVIFFGGAKFIHIPYTNGMGLGWDEMVLLFSIALMGVEALIVILNTILILTDREIKYWPVYQFLK